MAVVAVALLGGEDGRRDPRSALVLPTSEATGHRDHVVVAEILERLGRERAARSAGAIDDDRRVAVGELVLDLALEMPARNEHRAGNHPLLVLVELAHVEERRTAETGLGLDGIDLADLGLGLVEQLSKA